MRHIILTGFMGTGKSSVGELLASRLGIPFIDLDAVVVEVDGRPVKSIFEESGEPYFRKLESAALEELLRRDSRSVVATGGGVVIDPRNREIMLSNGVVVNLAASHDSLMRRLSGDDTRPLLSGSDRSDRAAMLMEQREKWYSEAHIRIDTSEKSVEDVVSDILRCLES